MLPTSRQPPRADVVRIADRLHSAAIHLLRRLRTEDALAGLTAPRLSALSVIVHAGPITLGDLARAEQVRPPTITRLVQDLERDGFVTRVADSRDRRITRVRATPQGKRLLRQGRTKRVEALAGRIAALPRNQRLLLRDAAEVIEKVIAGPTDSRTT